MLPKKKPAEPIASELISQLHHVALTPAELAELVQITMMRVESFAEDRIAELKASRDGQSLPIEFLRQQVIGAERCHCKIALRLTNG